MTAWVLLLATAPTAPTAVAMELVTDPAPVVLELFTSQGCASCPPADTYLGELAQRRDVLPLAFHVDYWNYIGWVDPFGSAASSTRQQEYGRLLQQRMIYTPQMVIDGAAHAVGSDRMAVEAAIRQAASTMKAPVTLTNDGSGYMVHIGYGEPDRPAQIWLIEYEPEAVTDVMRGENAGRQLTEFNIVRSWRAIGTWTGEPVSIDLPAAETGALACAVIVQADPLGPIYGAAAFRVD